MYWNCISVETNEQSADIVSFILTDEGAAGTEITGGSYPAQKQDELKPDAAYPDAVSVKAYFGAESFDEVLQNIKNRLTLLAYPGALNINVSRVEDSDWNENFRKNFKTFNAAGNIIIKPSWEKYAPKKGEVVIEMDPGMAFGSGVHETTKMCLELIQRYIKAGDLVADVGCGSGILGIACSKLGAKNVLALDNDTVSVQVTADNAYINGVSGITVKRSDLFSGAEDCKYDMILANIVADAVIRLNSDVVRHMNKDAVYIISGIIEDRMGDILDSLKKNHLCVVETLSMGDWRAAAVRLSK